MKDDDDFDTDEDLAEEELDGLFAEGEPVDVCFAGPAVIAGARFQSGEGGLLLVSSTEPSIDGARLAQSGATVA